MAKERITDGFYDEQQSLFALGVLNFSMWFVALVNRKKIISQRFCQAR